MTRFHTTPADCLPMKSGPRSASPRQLLRAAFLLLATLVALPAAAQAWQVPKPTPGLMPNPAVGKKLFSKNCTSCHGQDLKGTKQGPSFLHRYYVPSHHSDIAFQLAVKNGVRAHHWQFGDMKPVAGLNPNDVAHITAYIRSQQRLAGIK